MKKYTQAPLPFQGQKRRFLRSFKEKLMEYPANGIYIDLFGGSGILSHVVKEMYPDAKVIWNDFDNYQKRLNHIEDTNQLLAKIRPLLDLEPKDKKIRNEVKKVILEIVKKAKYVDYVTLSANLLFSEKHVNTFEELEKQTFYNTFRQSDYNADGYLQGVERVQDDFRIIFEKYKDYPDVVFMVDPPYLSTDTKTYKSDSYWQLKDYLGVIDVLSGNYFYFTSNKSQIVDLCQWIESRTGDVTVNPFYGSTTSTVGGSVNYNSSYMDMMFCKKAT